MTRKPLAVVKSVLHRNCTDLPRPSGIDRTVLGDDDTWCEYAPFDGPDATALLGFLDSSFLFCYAFAMFFSGLIAERVSLRYFISLGMLFSGFFCYAFGYAKVRDIHSMTYFLIVQGLAGIFQTTGDILSQLCEILMFFLRMAECRDNCESLVWKIKARINFWHLEFAHIDRKHGRNLHCRSLRRH